MATESAEPADGAAAEDAQEDAQGDAQGEVTDAAEAGAGGAATGADRTPEDDQAPHEAAAVKESPAIPRQQSAQAAADSDSGDGARQKRRP